MTDEMIREIDSGTVMTRFARGWHCLGLAELFHDGEPHGIEAFGTKLVVFADSHGEIKVLDGYCRHMGGDLSQGTIKGDNIACPFHDWRWGGDGKCALVPYAKRTPKLARTRSWPTLEVNGQLLVWHDPEGSAPPPELSPPAIDGYVEGKWSSWQWNSIHIEGSHCREIVDNNVDMAHFFYIHHAYPTYFKNVIEGQTASQFMESKPRPDFVPNPEKLWEGTGVRSEATYFGPAYMIDWIHNDLGPGFTVEVALINCHYPVTHDSFVLQWGVAIQEMPDLPPDNARKLAAAMARSFGRIPGGCRDLEEQDAHRQSVTHSGGRCRLSTPALVRAVLRGSGRCHAGHDRTLRDRGGHHACPRGVGARGRRKSCRAGRHGVALRALG